ncbi:hypothetical protein FQW43_27330 [Salmonella enterica subsp. enterica serovar Enteritidis]|nr:hypothetical protein [Salmonella enterica subsp. enterica serovar Enteritidis]
MTGIEDLTRGDAQEGRVVGKKSPVREPGELTHDNQICIHQLERRSPSGMNGRTTISISV